MRISELARRAGTTPSAVRWYEAAGILPDPPRNPNGYREYGEGDLAELRLVVAFRRLGLPATESGRLARQCVEKEAGDPALAATVATQLDAVRRQRQNLASLKAELLDLQATLAAVGRSKRRDMPDLADIPASPIRVLFVCTHNSARSQIAEAMLSRLGGPDFEVFSAGTEATRVNPYALRVLASQGIDWTAARSKTVHEFLGQEFDYVITVCDRARETCPVLPGSVNTLHWGLPDPSEVQGSDAERLAAFEQTLSEITARLRPFIEIARRAHRPSPAGRR
jgi:arsenate reductase